MVKTALVAAVIAAASVADVAAQNRPIYLQFDPYTVKGALYRPDGGEPDIGVLLIHRVNNYLGHIAGWELARRGFLVLAMNSRYDNNEASVLWERLALDVKTGVEYLRKQGGVRRVILFGHSGGAATLSFYQAVAEKGPAFCQAPGKLTHCRSDEMENLPRADGLILVDASLGNPVGLLRSLNPAVVAEGDPTRIDPALDPFNPANGFNPSGPPSYTPEFRQKYSEAQAARMNRLIAAASAAAAQLGTGRAPFPDDNVFLIVRASGARLPDADVVANTATVSPRKLLRNNGTVVTQIVRTSRPPTSPNPLTNGTFESGARLLTLSPS
jgi:pimeloyl-ACP methyl ester carboxylesterase